MKSKIMIIVGLVLAQLLVGVFIIFEKSEIGNGSDAPYLEIRYNSNDRACLTFYENGKYSMYNCDSDPTNYFFDNENDCTYKYYSSSNKIIFKCNYNSKYKHHNYIKVLEWDENHIKFDYEGDIKTFKAER